MKQLNLYYRGIDWFIIMIVDSLGSYDTTIYRARQTKKRGQSICKHFDDFVSCPDSISQQLSIILKVIDDKLEYEAKLKNFIS